MIAFFKSLLGLTPRAPIDMENAYILDVRTEGEFASGHVPGSVNIPLQALQHNLNRIPKNKKIITCCASGMRSASAASILRGAGFDAENGGSWTRLR